MKQKKTIQSVCAFLLTLLLLIPLTLPAHAASNKKDSPRERNAAETGVNIYLLTAVLQKQFQGSISQSLPTQFNQSLLQRTENLPASDRLLVSQFAGELFQPSATLTQLTPQSEGLVATIRISLFPNDPHPSSLSLIFAFNKQSATSARVTSRALPGQPALPAIGGNGSAFNFSLGQLNSITTTPGCGVAALKMNIVPPNQGQLAPNAAPSAPPPGGVPLIIETPAAMLSAGTSNASPMQIAPGFTVKNIQLSTQPGGLLVTTHIFLGPKQIGTTTTSIQLSAANGKMVATVTNTQLKVAGFSFPVNSFNQRMQQMINQQLNAGNSLYVTHVSIGPTNDLPCAASGSLVMEGIAAGV